MRRYLGPAIVLTLLGFLVGSLYRHFFDPAAEETVAFYIRSCVHGAALALSGWTVHLYFTSRRSAWLRRWPLAVELVIRSLAMALVIASVAIILEVVLYGYAGGLGTRMLLFWLVDDFPRIMAVSFVLSIVIGIGYELTRLIGIRVLFDVFLGRYRRPIREQRVLLFLDLVGSTTLAEQMGELRVQDLLTRFFYDIDEAIVRHSGEVHAYVGDEVIVSWSVGTRAKRSYVDCFFAIEDRIAALADRYMQEFGVVPEFRAGIHAGPVVISECGDSRRQVAYFGDTVNVAARLQAHCKEAGRRLLVSAELVNLLPDVPDFLVEPLGATELRGRAAPVEVFAVARRSPEYS